MEKLSGAVLRQHYEGRHAGLLVDPELEGDIKSIFDGLERASEAWRRRSGATKRADEENFR